MTTNHYKKLRKFLPNGYLQSIAKETNASISLVNKVIRGIREDKKGILVELYRIANTEKKKQVKNEKNLQYSKKHKQ